MQTLKEWGAFLILGVFAWGTSFLWIKIGVLELGPMRLITYRLLIGAIFIWLVIWLKKTKITRDYRAIGMMAFVGIINSAIPFTLLALGEVYIDSGLAGILNGTVPLFTMIIAHLALHDDRMTISKVVGLIAGFVGLVLLLSVGETRLELTDHMIGQLAVVGAAIMYAISSVVIRRYLKDQRPVVITAIATTSGFLGIALFTPILEGPFILPATTEVWVAVLWLGSIGTAFAYLLYFYLIQAWGPTRSTLVTYVMPVVAVVLGVLFLNELITWQLVAGGLLIIGGIAVVNYRPKHRRGAKDQAAPVQK